VTDTHLRPMPVQVYGISRRGKTRNGNSVWELSTNRGALRTAANSAAGAALSPRRYSTLRPVPMMLYLNSRGTVSGIKYT